MAENPIPPVLAQAVARRRERIREANRTYRRRRNDGIAIFAVPVQLAVLEDVLLKDGFLSEALADDEDAVRSAGVAWFIDCLSRRCGPA